MSEEKRRAIEVLCLQSPAVLAEVMAGDNMMARTVAVRQAEALRVGAVAEAASSNQRGPGLTIVIQPPLGSNGAPVAYQPPQLLDVTPPKGEPVPATSDVEADPNFIPRE
jgi:hypothetical protein